MIFVIYFLFLLMSAGGMFFGIDLLTSPLPAKPPSAYIGRPVPLPPQRAERKASEKTHVVRRELSPVYPASPGPSANVVTRAAAAAAPQPGDEYTVAPAQTDTFAGAPGDAVPAQNSCNVQACEAAYRSFNAVDCTYQPRVGPRRLCAKSDATAQAAASLPARSRQARAAPLRLAPKHAARGPERRNALQWTVRQRPQRRGLFTQSGNDGANETPRIVRRMTRGRIVGDIAVQRADGSIVIVRAGEARAQFR
jgi:hypothetical protein